MFQEGKIKNYNADRGFGFIEVDGEKRDVFFHITDFPNKNIAPKVGENLKFRKVQDGEKFKADNIVRLDISSEIERYAYRPSAKQITKSRANRVQQKQGSLFSNFISYMRLLTIIGLAYLVFNKYQDLQNNTKSQQVNEAQVVQQNFSCDGREHCSQMGSYEEAAFFLKNCPNTKMDGDYDGQPCENDSRW